MRKLSLFLLVIILLAQKSWAQDEAALPQLPAKQENIIKLNVPALVLRNYSVQYERKISSKFSASLAVRFIPFGNLPLHQKISKYADLKDVEVKDFKLGSFSALPELRFYPGKKGALRGFYLGVFGNYSTYKTAVPVNINDENAIFKGDITTLTGGLQIGVQSKISKRIYLDVWILGPNIGMAKGSLVCKNNFTSDEQDELVESIEDFKKEAPFDFISSYQVNSNGANIKINGPWAGLRGLGISLGFRF